MPEVRATASPTAASVLTVMVATSPTALPVLDAPTRCARTSTTAAATSNTGYRTSSTAVSGLPFDAVRNSRMAQTRANPKRTR
jgi:hypothetical protein